MLVGDTIRINRTRLCAVLWRHCASSCCGTEGKHVGGFKTLSEHCLCVLLILPRTPETDLQLGMCTASTSIVTILKPKVAKMQISVLAFPPSVAKFTHATFEFEVYVLLLKILLTRQENSPRRENWRQLLMWAEQRVPLMISLIPQGNIDVMDILMENFHIPYMHIRKADLAGWFNSEWVKRVMFT